MTTACESFDRHGLRAQNDKLIDIPDMTTVLHSLYVTIDKIDLTLMLDLAINWILNVYDSQRTGQIRVLSFKVGLVLLCRGHLEEKYRYLFRLVADTERRADQRRLGLLLHDCIQVSVRTIYKRGNPINSVSLTGAASTGRSGRLWWLQHRALGAFLSRTGWHLTGSHRW